MIDLLKEAQQVVRSKLSWSSGEIVSVVEAGDKSVWIRESDGLLKLYASHKAGDKLTDRYTSKGLVVGMLDMATARWTVAQYDGYTPIETAYRQWLAQVQKEVKANQERVARRLSHADPVRAFTRRLLVTRTGEPRPKALPAACNDGVGMAPDQPRNVAQNVAKWAESH